MPFFAAGDPMVKKHAQTLASLLANHAILAGKRPILERMVNTLRPKDKAPISKVIAKASEEAQR